MKLHTTIEEFLKKFKNYRFVCSCQMGSKLSDVLLIMLKHRCQAALILDKKDGKLIGMINTLDVCSIITNGSLTLCDPKTNQQEHKPNGINKTESNSVEKVKNSDSINNTEDTVGNHDEPHVTPTNPGKAEENDADIGTTTDSQIGIKA